jgi:predicted AlkP superfamily phosphohydrolase/phosphomutase
MSKKVLFIGLDGATFDVLDPLMAKGLMPRLKRFIDEGVSGLLETTIPPITPTAWVSLDDRKNPSNTESSSFCCGYQSTREAASGKNPKKEVAGYEG